MSEVNRYNHEFRGMIERPKGQFVLAADYANLKAERDALSAENVALKEFFSVGISAAFEGCDWYGDDIQGKALELGLIREEKYDHETHAESVFNPEDFQQGDAVFTINETPATEAYLNSVRDDVIKQLHSEQKEWALVTWQYDSLDALKRAAVRHGDSELSGVIFMLDRIEGFATQLRAGEPS